MAAIQSGKFRHPKGNFAQISNTALRDSQISLKAKGLYSLIQSYITIPDFDLYKWYLLKQCKEGENAFQGAWQELKNAGYLKQFRIPSGDRGQFCYEYELLDQPNCSTPAMMNLNRSGEASKEGIDHTPHLAPYAKSTQCSEHPVLNRGDNNTDLDNTYRSNRKSICPSDDRRTDEIRNGLREQIEYDYFQDNYPDAIPGLDAVIDCMADMLSRKSTNINGVGQSRESLKTYIDKVNSIVIREFLEHIRGKELRGITNMNAYWQSALINYLREQELRLLQIKII